MARSIFIFIFIFSPHSLSGSGPIWFTMRFSCVSGLTDCLTVSNIQSVSTHSQFNDTYVTRLLLVEITLAMVTALCYRFGYSLEPSPETMLPATTAVQRPARLRSTVRCSPLRSQVSLGTSRGDSCARHYSYVDQFHRRTTVDALVPPSADPTIDLVRLNPVRRFFNVFGERS